MAGIRIGQISISLSAETASFTSSMEKASAIAVNSSRNIEKSFGLMATAIGAATGAAVGSLGLLVDRTEDVLFNMQKMAQQAGVSIESFSKLAFAAKAAGMPVDAMSTILTRISHSSFEAASGSQQAQAAYKALGISVTDASGRFKTADTLVLELSKRLSQYRDSASKTGIETMIMGRSGAEAASFLKVLATRFDEISGKAERLGVVFNAQTAVQAQRLHESLDDLEQAALGLSVRLLSNVSPALDQLADKIVAFVSNAENMRKVEDIGHDIAHGIEIADKAITFLIEHADTLKAILEFYAGMRLGGFLLPMITSASETTGLLGKLAIALGNISGRMLGLGRLGTSLGPLAKNATGYASAIGELAREEGVASAASLALSDAALAAGGALEALAATAGPIALVAASIWEVYEVSHVLHDTNAELKQDGLDWKDTWQSAIHSTIGSWEALKDTIAGISQMGPSYIGLATGADLASKIPGKLTGGKDFSTAPGLPTDYKKWEQSPDPQKDLHALEQTEKIEQLKQKLAELTNKAHEATHAYAAIGLDPDAARKLEIQDKVLQFQIEQKKNLDALSESHRRDAVRQAEAAISTEVMVKAATAYKDALLSMTQSVQSSIQEHLAMAAAVGKSAQAMQDAAVAAKVNQEMQRLGGNGWRNNPQMVADAEKRAQQIREEMNAANAEADAQSLANMQLQIDAQSRLNAAIMEGADARRQAAVEAEIAQARAEFANRKDTDTAALERQIQLIREKAQLEHDQEALQRAAALNPAQQYREQEQALRDAVAAASRYGQAIDFTAVLAADYDAWKQFADAQREDILKTGSAMDGLRAALNQIADDTASNAKLMYDAISNVVQQLNDAIVKTAMLNNHQPHAVRNIFAGAFRSMGETIMKGTLQKAEGVALQKLGLGTPGKPDGSSEGKAFWVKLAKQNGNPANQTADVTSPDVSGSFDQNGNFISDLTSATVMNGGILGTIAKRGLGWLSGLLGMFGGIGLGAGGGITNMLGAFAGFADGGDFPGGVPMVVGERGPELMIPQASGTVVPNSGLKNLGGGHTFYIDASHSNDPAATVAAVHSYLQQNAPKIVEKSVQAVHDVQRRVPRTKL
jgi:hypothetical protein